MKESHIEGTANHDDPESCTVRREVAGEALTGARTGRLLSREINQLRDADAVNRSGRQHAGHRHREVPSDPARSKTLARTETFCARTGRSSDSLAAEGAAGRIGKAEAVRR